MRSKKLLFSTLVALVSISTYIVLGSNSNASSGVMGKANSGGGCSGGGCHSATASTNTTIAFSGVPAAGYTPGTAYPVTLTITNTAKAEVGFDLAFSAGVISANTGTTALMGTKELHHNAPLTATSGVTVISFTWTAPATSAGTIILNTVANAVDGTGSPANDEWANKTFDILERPSAINNQIIGEMLTLFPNPTTENSTIKTSEKIISAQAIGMLGNKISINIQKNANDTYTINTSNLAFGNYLILLKGEKSNFHSILSKQ